MTDSPVTKTAETVLAVAQVLREAGDSAYLPDVERALREAGLLASGAPSEEQIERAARALWAGHGLNGEWEAGTYEAHELCREDARAALAAAGVGSPVPVQVDEAKAEAFEEAAAQIPFPADPYGGFDHESLRGAYTQMTNWLRGRAEMLRGGAQ